MVERASSPSDDPLLRAFARRVRETVARDLERERAESELLRQTVLPKVRDGIAEARARGDCGEAWLFGSFAWGQPGERSDLDLLVSGCSDPDALAGRLWRACGRAVHVIDRAHAPPALVQRVLAEGLRL